MTRRLLAGRRLVEGLGVGPGAPGGGAGCRHCALQHLRLGLRLGRWGCTGGPGEDPECPVGADTSPRSHLSLSPGFSETRGVSPAKAQAGHRPDERPEHLDQRGPGAGGGGSSLVRRGSSSETMQEAPWEASAMEVAACSLGWSLCNGPQGPHLLVKRMEQKQQDATSEMRL